VIDRGLASEGWNEIHDEIARALRTKRPDPLELRSILERSHGLLPEARLAFATLARRNADAGAADVPG
jgi:hypothetical protein